MTVEELLAKLQSIKDKEEVCGEPMFLGTPDRWYETHQFRCTNDHVSNHYIKSEVKGDLCPGCMCSTIRTFPEDKDGPINELEVYNSIMRRDSKPTTEI